MNRIDKAFIDKVFAAYFTVGDGDESYLLSIAKALLEGRVNLLEIGIPFSDPIADGPVIQNAMARALKRGATPQDALSLALKIREFSDIPLVLFTYLNPLLAMGDSFLDAIKKAGFDAILIVDLPFEEGIDYYKKIKKAGLISIFIATPSTSETRLKKILEHAEGFLYYVTRKGTTGIRDRLPSDFEAHISRIKSLTNIPVLAGFGLSNAESITEALKYVEGIVVGSAIVKLIGERKSPDEIKKFIEQIHQRGSSCFKR